MDTKRNLLDGVMSSFAGLFGKQNDLKESKVTHTQTEKKANFLKENVESMNGFNSAIRSKRKAIDDALINVARYFGKEMTLKNFKEIPPIKLFEELKRAELRYDKESNQKYHTAATKLQIKKGNFKTTSIQDRQYLIPDAVQQILMQQA